jgi:serine/threonine-protein kinase HipA
MRGLNVWMNGELVGLWSQARSGVHSFRYEESWVTSPAGRSLSLSLPITAGARELRGPVVENYFDNLLPDNERMRDRLRSRFAASSTAALDLLSAIGRDCVGAVQLLPPGAAPEGVDRIRSETLTDDEVERVLRGVTSARGLGMHDGDDDDEDGFRISLAGAQEKTALLRVGDRWCRPHGATPTTHILKLPLGLVGGMQIDMSGSVENEWLCAQIVHALGLPVARTEIATFGSQKVLVVERFDRQRMGSGRKAWIARLPQEDFCQASGLPPGLKYEADGGPGMQRCLDVLAASEAPDADRARFLLSQLAFWLLAATDGHAKNFSIFHKRDGAFALTPLYDVLSAWPVIGEGPNQISAHRAKLAMALRTKNAHYRLRDIHARHWNELALRSGVSSLWDRMLGLVEGAPAALDRVSDALPARFPARLWSRVAQGVRAQARHFLEQAADASSSPRA